MTTSAPISDLHTSSLTSGIRFTIGVAGSGMSGIAALLLELATR
jgi:UDP-N-acetylmuramate-alanine ligase